MKQISINWLPLMIPFIREIGWQSEYSDSSGQGVEMFVYVSMRIYVNEHTREVLRNKECGNISIKFNHLQQPVNKLIRFS